MEGSYTWDEEQIEAFEHDRWLLMQELGDNYYMLYENNYREGEDEEQAIIILELEEEEEKTKKNLLQGNSRKGKERLQEENSGRAQFRKECG